MSVNYEISDIFNYSYTGPVSNTVNQVAAAAEVFTITTTGAFAGASQGQYFIIYSALNATGYYVWNDTAGDATTGDPAPPGLTEVAVDTSAAANDGDIAIAIQLAVNALADFNATVLGNVVTVTNAAIGHAYNAANDDLAPWNSLVFAVTTAGSSGPNAGSGLLYRDAANDDEVRILGASATVGQVLATTATNVIGWQNAAEVATNSEFVVRPTVSQTIINGALGTFTEVVWGTEIYDPGNHFAANQYVAADAGTYQFTAHIEWSTTLKNNKGTRQTRIRNVTTTTDLITVSEAPNSNNAIAFWQHASILAVAAASNAFNVGVAHDATTNQSIGILSRWYGYRIG